MSDPNAPENEKRTASDQAKSDNSKNKGGSPNRKFSSITQKPYIYLSNGEHTPRFSVTNRAKSPQSISVSDFGISPGPADYDTRVNSCHKNIQRQPSFTTEKRFLNLNKPAARPEAGFYDTRPAIHLLLKKGPTVCIPTQKRVISPHLFNAKNAKAF